MITEKIALQILKELRISSYNNNINNLNRTEEEAKYYCYRFVRHCIVVGKISKLLAKEMNLDNNKAYLMGLMHDIGRFQHKRYHGLYGYKFLLEIDSAIAQPAITHTHIKVGGYDTCFFDMCKKSNPQNKSIYDEDELETKRILNKIVFDDYDYIVALADTLSIGLKLEADTLDNRLQDIKDRYYKNANTEQLNLFYELKNNKKSLEKYISDKIGGNADDVLKTIKERDEDYFELFFDDTWKENLGKNFEDIYVPRFKERVKNML
jgi:putative nucleotidyltransferase with HDIG domain